MRPARPKPLGRYLPLVLGLLALAACGLGPGANAERIARQIFDALRRNDVTAARSFFDPEYLPVGLPRDGQARPSLAVEAERLSGADLRDLRSRVEREAQANPADRGAGLGDLYAVIYEYDWKPRDASDWRPGRTTIRIREVNGRLRAWGLTLS